MRVFWKTDTPQRPPLLQAPPPVLPDGPVGAGGTSSGPT